MKILNKTANAVKTVTASVATISLGAAASKSFGEGLNNVLPYVVTETIKPHFWSKKTEVLKVINPLNGKECGQIMTDFILTLEKEVY